jgi:hypothetical protein
MALESCTDESRCQLWIRSKKLELLSLSVSMIGGANRFGGVKAPLLDRARCAVTRFHELEFTVLSPSTQHLHPMYNSLP